MGHACRRPGPARVAARAPDRSTPCPGPRLPDAARTGAFVDSELGRAVPRQTLKAQRTKCDGALTRNGEGSARAEDSTRLATRDHCSERQCMLRALPAAGACLRLHTLRFTAPSRGDPSSGRILEPPSRRTASERMTRGDLSRPPRCPSRQPDHTHRATLGEAASLSRPGRNLTRVLNVFHAQTSPDPLRAEPTMQASKRHLGVVCDARARERRRHLAIRGRVIAESADHLLLDAADRLQ
jgi:hypothetical protein